MRVMSRLECKTETMIDLMRSMDDRLRLMAVKLGVMAAVISIAVGYLVRDLSWLGTLLGGLI